MDEFALKREKMVKDQLIGRGIKDNKVINAMKKIQRHLFVAEKYKEKAYDDSPVLIECSQTISQPYMVALMTELLGLSGDEIVLEIGTGTGYQTAILAELSSYVYSLERHPLLAENARILLEELGYTNIEIELANGSLGLMDKAPFDAILVSAGAPTVPNELVTQLKDYGKMVIPVGDEHQQKLMLISKRGDSYIDKSICGCVFVPLIGKRGWSK